MRKSEPLPLRIEGSKGGTGPLDWPNNASVPRGLMALFGQSSGPVPPFELNTLNGKGSLYVTRPSLGHYVLTRDELLWRAGDVLNWIDSGKLKLRIDRTYPLAEAPAAHRALEGRHTAGKLLLSVP